jgi:hypothetical protein
VFTVLIVGINLFFWGKEYPTYTPSTRLYCGGIRWKTTFIEGMTWGKVISGEIHLDHIKPIASFDLSKPEEQKKCFHWSNYQCLWAFDNLSKGAIYEGVDYRKR